MMDREVYTSFAVVLQLGSTDVDLEDGKPIIALTTQERVQIFMLFEPNGWGTGRDPS